MTVRVDYKLIDRAADPVSIFLAASDDDKLCGMRITVIDPTTDDYAPLHYRLVLLHLNPGNQNAGFARVVDGAVHFWNEAVAVALDIDYADDGGRLVGESEPCFGERFGGLQRQLNDLIIPRNA